MSFRFKFRITFALSLISPLARAFAVGFIVLPLRVHGESLLFVVVVLERMERSDMSKSLNG